MELSKNHVLQGGKYRIIEKIGQGGFAITYKANFATEVTGTMGKITTDVTVAIKEFFFADYCVRDSDNSFITVSSPTGNQIFGKFKEKLRKEATILSRLRHPNIVSVFDIFEENNTIYMVMEYIDGLSLKQTIINQGGLLNEATTLRYASQLCEAVAEIHRNNVLHLDIKPGNILIDNNDNVKLIDFGISKQYNSETHTETSTTPVGISKGFAPLEQYSGVSQFSPATDIYAIGATIYNMLSGQTPPESMYLLEEDLPHINGVSNQMWTAVTSAMQTRRNQRPQTVSELIALFPEANKIASPVIAHNIMQSDEKTQIANQELTPKPSIPTPTQKEIDQPKKTVASNNETMVERVTSQAVYTPIQNVSSPTSSSYDEDSEPNNYDLDDQLYSKWCVKSVVAKIFFGLTCVSVGFALIYYQWLNHGDGVSFTDVNWFLWATLIGMFLTSFYVSFIARKEYRQFSKEWWIRLVLFLSLSTISFVIWANNADHIYLRDAQFIALNILSIIILSCCNLWLKRNNKPLFAGIILGYIGYALCFVGALDKSEYICKSLCHDNYEFDPLFCWLLNDSSYNESIDNIEWYYISGKDFGEDSIGQRDKYRLVKSRKIGSWEFPGWGHHFHGYMEEVNSRYFNSIYYVADTTDTINRVVICGSDEYGMSKIVDGYIQGSIYDSDWYSTEYHSLEDLISQNEEVDLGLPSGTIWAGHNIGSDCVQDPGRILTTEYSNLNNTNMELPSITQFEELVNYCTWIRANYRGTVGYMVIGPNGKRIFLPTGGNGFIRSIEVFHFYGDYIGQGNAFLKFDPSGPSVSTLNSSKGLIRPVLRM